jgi:hypothetical protein
MKARIPAFLVVALACSASPACAQRPAASAPPTAAEAIFRARDVAIARRAAELIASPAQWNRSDAAGCDAKAMTFSVRCALQVASDEATAAHSSAPKGPHASSPSCQFQPAGGYTESNCGEFFDEESIFAAERVKAVSTGVWRKDVAPSEVWSGRMTNPSNPAMDEARRLINVIAPGKYKNARLGQFNDDTSVTFVKLQEYFRALEDRLGKLTTEEALQSSDSVEIEVYSGGAGVMRTYTGWYNVSGFSATASQLRFQVDTVHEILSSPLDIEIVKRADAILSSDAVWNRADDRKCNPAATTWSIYCALERATRELTGGFSHRRPAMEQVRLIVEKRTYDKKYNHRLMDYNNDKATVLADVRSLFAEALAKMRRHADAPPR